MRTAATSSGRAVLSEAQFEKLKDSVYVASTEMDL
jgi:hypothetical protein